MKDLARFKPMQRHLFLYEKALVFCKKREDHADSYEKTSSYSFKHLLKVRKLKKINVHECIRSIQRKEVEEMPPVGTFVHISEGGGSV